MNILDGIKNSSDVKRLSLKEKIELAEEIRDKILKTCSENGGHLSSNLGIVETTLALYSVFDFPKDKIIFDVGHQCYAHKMLSGRNAGFSAIRTDGGISGFPDREESEYDCFGAGHAGTSIAAGLGFCAARDALGEDFYVVDVVGDGAFVNGLNLEALTASQKKPKKLIVILNDNGMSISKNRNGVYTFLSKKSTKKGYLKSKSALKRVFGESFVTRFLRKVRGFIKRIFNGVNVLEQFGFKYVGVVNGNDLKSLTEILEGVKNVAKDKAVFLHIKTVKGKGVKRAEERADLYHGVGKSLSCGGGEFSAAVGQTLNEIIEKDSRVIALTAGMKDGTGLAAVEKAHPDNFIDVGIAEEFAVTFAAGMAACGLKPVVCVYSTFLQRAYDEILHDVCIQKLPVVFCIDRAGLVGADGKTHQGVFDLSFLSHLPGMTILAPSCVNDLKAALKYAFSLGSPVAIRYPKESSAKEREVAPYEETLWERLKTGEKYNILAVGPDMLALAEEFAKNHDGAGVISARTVKPLDEKTLAEISGLPIIAIEENSVIGGFGDAVRRAVSRLFGGKPKNRIITLGVKDAFTRHGSAERQREENGLCEKQLEAIVLSLKENRTSGDYE